MFDLSNVSVSGLIESVGLLGTAFVAFLAVVGLRLTRRGRARFWTGPGVVALVLLPVALGTGLSAFEFRRFLPTLAASDSTGTAARAGLAIDVLIPLLVGLLGAAAVALSGLLAIAIGSSKEKAGPSDGGAGGPAVALVVLWLSAGLAVFVVQTLAAAVGSEQYLPASNLKVDLSLLGSAILATSLIVLVLFTALRAPRGSAPPFVKLASLSAISLCGLVTFAGLWAVQRKVRCYSETMSTGKPCDAASDPAAVTTAEGAETPGSAPAPEVEPSSAPGANSSVERTSSPEPSPALPSPPPPPKPRQAPVRAAPAAQKAAPRVAEPAAPPVEALARKEPPAPLRVGGSIKEPKKIKNVKPRYPPIALQARVQGIVILECTIGPEGEVTQVRVLRGIPLLDQAAIEAVEQWVYAPTLVDGVAVPVIMTVTINFKL